MTAKVWAKVQSIETPTRPESYSTDEQVDDLKTY